MDLKSVIVSFARTPIGSFQGALSTVSAVNLGSLVIKAVLDRAKLDKSEIDEVIMGNVLSAGVGQAPARQASIAAGLSDSVECMTINKVCGSGLKSIMLADQAIRCGDSNVIIAGGMENMSQTPYYLFNARDGMRLGHNKVIDGMIHDGLWDPYNNIHMGSCAEKLSEDKSYSRIDQDQFAIESYHRSSQAIKNGFFKDEIVSVEVVQKKGKLIIIDTDEEPNRMKPDKINKLPSAFKKNGTITVANASSINDGAAAVMVMSQERSMQLNVKPICKIISQVSFAHDPLYFTTAPANAISKVLDKCGYNINDIDLFEINEAFSNVVMSAMDEHNISHDKVNIHGGSISLGHPIGSSGTRILVTLISALQQRDKKRGLATLCIGGGEANAIIVELC